MIILGLDPGTTLIGFGVIKKTGSFLLPLEYGVIDTAGFSPEQKLNEIEKKVTALIKKHQPDRVAIEKLFFSKNVKTALAVSEAKGVLMLCAEKLNRPVCYFTPPQIKQSVSGYGQAGKKQVQQMVKLILKLKEVPQPDDTADALAAAICCAHSEMTHYV